MPSLRQSAWILALAITAPDARAVGRLADVTVVDRRTGAVLETRFYRGEYWVAGTPGGRYSVSIRNRTPERLLAVASVDGINVISGENAGWQQTGYVFDPLQGYEILGWRKSDRDVADFEFTASPNSYAERTGRPANVGVIGVALFRERSAPQAAVAAPAPESPSPAAAGRAESSTLGDANRAKAADATGRRLAAQPAPKLGTGHGEREVSYVEHTTFDRLSDQPNEVIRIRYDSYENLVAMGVIRAPLPARPDPFPDAPQRYVPDPPGFAPSRLR